LLSPKLAYAVVMDVAWRRLDLLVAGAIVLALAGCGGGRRGGGGLVVDSGAPRADAAMPMTDAGIVPRTDSGTMPLMDAGTVRPDAGPPRPDSGGVVRLDAGPPRPDSGGVVRLDAGGLPPLPDGGGLGACTSVADCAPGNDCCMLLPGIGLCLPTGSCPAP
jgi:hypothetical protein